MCTKLQFEIIKRGAFMKEKVYKIYRWNDIFLDDDCFYIKTDKTKEELAQIIHDFISYVENNTIVGKKYNVLNSMVAYCLYRAFGCQILDKSQISRCKQYDKASKDISKEYHIDIDDLRDMKHHENYLEHTHFYEMYAREYRYNLHKKHVE